MKNFRLMLAALAISSLPAMSQAGEPLKLDDAALDQVTAGIAFGQIQGGATAFGTISSASGFDAAGQGAGNQYFTSVSVFGAASAFAFGQGSTANSQTAALATGDFARQTTVTHAGAGRYHAYSVSVSAGVAVDFN